MKNIYSDISRRTQGDIYLGVVGPVRTGKSTFIKRFMEELVLPNMGNDFVRDRAVDELPQSAAGKTIMTTEPKFIPNEAAELILDKNAKANVRLIDCVGFIVPGARGLDENEQPRMVSTPWSDSPLPFDEAAEIGTRKVICEHSTIGIVVTTDGSIGELPRENYVEAEERVIQELKDINKPFIVVLNTVSPADAAVKELAGSLSEKYNVPVLATDCLSMGEKEIHKIMEQILFEFPIRQVGISLPDWVVKLPREHWLKASVFEDIMAGSENISKIRQVDDLIETLSANQNVSLCDLSEVTLGEGRVDLTLESPKTLFYQILSEETGVSVDNDGDLISLVSELSRSKESFDKIANALSEADCKGYGIVTPSVSDLSLDEPEIVKQGSRFGVKLKAAAPSYHIIKAKIETEVSPVVGSEKQSEDLVKYLLTEFEEDPKKIWESNLFGKTLYELVNEGLHSKLYHMPDDAREKVRETLEKIINEGSNGLICIIL